MDGAHSGIHPPKVEYFDIEEHTNTDPKGFVRAVDHYRVEPWGLYMARPADHREFHYLESWLLPDLGLRASVFHFRPSHQRDQDFYVDIGAFTRGEWVWKSEDHYLDLVIRTGRDTELLDVDELLEAHSADLLDTATATRAIRTATTAIEGIVAHGHDLERWLDSIGIPIEWRH